MAWLKFLEETQAGSMFGMVLRKVQSVKSGRPEVYSQIFEEDSKVGTCHSLLEWAVYFDA